VFSIQKFKEAEFFNERTDWFCIALSIKKSQKDPFKPSLEKDEDYKVYLHTAIDVFSGVRISDFWNLKYSGLINGETTVIKEIKTKKTISVKIYIITFAYPA
jgi:hypothetical protein